ncbi:hypothetical protein H6F78_12975 [Coleofasciculus sp. FACHB-64]|uniref:hypothetical protein n=1 Tax=Cyanophyceae TaxID=3028117 RepID=UPI001687F3A9|nr:MULTISPECIES: hypothetical protein [unclassified Coleofasciculus]MBD1840215.1 hypothetical protein [Coleofasciculus sp. FACHB-501]MBD2046495.1 hypothetical protein [Coleofasciculus sp. FACHB-64]
MRSRFAGENAIAPPHPKPTQKSIHEEQGSALFSLQLTLLAEETGASSLSYFCMNWFDDEFWVDDSRR